MNELAIELTAGKPVKQRGFVTVPLEVTIPMEKLMFLPRDDGKYVASFDLHFASAGEQRDFVAGGKQQQLIEITAEQHARLGGMKYRYRTGMEVAPGPVRIAIGVLDTATKLTGFARIDVAAK